VLISALRASGRHHRGVTAWRVLGRCAVGPVL